MNSVWNFLFKFKTPTKRIYFLKKEMIIKD